MTLSVQRLKAYPDIENVVTFGLFLLGLMRKQPARNSWRQLDLKDTRYLYCARHFFGKFDKCSSVEVNVLLFLQIGKTKVFLKAGQMAELDARRTEVLGRAARIIQSKFRSYLLLKAATNLQAVCRGREY